jgi:hypothetical protein
MKICLLVTIFLFLSFATRSFAYLEFEDAIFPELATSGRALAMGNAYIAKADDSAAAFYNPAGLGSVRYPHVHLSNFLLETNKDWWTMQGNGSAGNIGKHIGKGFDMDGVRQLLVDNRGRLSHTRAQMVPNITTRYFSTGYLYSQIMRAYLGKETTSLYEYNSRRDHGPYVSLNFSLFGGIFKGGATAVFLNRREAVGQADPNLTIQLGDDQYQKGKAVIITGGAKLTFPVTLLPTIAATWHNVGNQHFSGRGAGSPPTIRRRIDVAGSITPFITNTSRFHIEIDYKDLDNRYPNVSSQRKLLAGAEWDIHHVMFIRIGYGDGFGCAGLGIKTKRVEMDLTTYAVDTTTSDFRGKEDRRFVLGISSGF